MNKIYALFLISLFSCKEGHYEEHIFIPKDYEGKVFIKYNVKTSKNRIIKSGKDSYLFFITGDPMFFEVYDPMPDIGYYTSHTYYYDTDTLYEINTSGTNNFLPNTYPMRLNGGTNDIGRGFEVWKDSTSAYRIDSLKAKAQDIYKQKETKRRR